MTPRRPASLFLTSLVGMLIAVPTLAAPPPNAVTSLRTEKDVFRELEDSTRNAKHAHVFEHLLNAYGAVARSRIVNEPFHYFGFAVTDDESANLAIIVGIDSAKADRFTGTIIVDDPLYLGTGGTGTITGDRRGIGSCSLHVDLPRVAMHADLQGLCESALLMQGRFESRYGSRSLASGYYYVESDRIQSYQF